MTTVKQLQEQRDHDVTEFRNRLYQLEQDFYDRQAKTRKWHMKLTEGGVLDRWYWNVENGRGVRSAYGYAHSYRSARRKIVRHLEAQDRPPKRRGKINKLP